MRYTFLIFLSLVSLDANAGSLNKNHYALISEVIKVADKIGVPRELLVPLCWGEGLHTKAVGKNPTHMDGASLSYGICQVKLDAAKWVDQYAKLKVKATPKRLENPYVNAFYAAALLKYYLKKHGRWELAVDAYNKGFGTVSSRSEYVKHFKSSKVFILQNSRVSAMLNKGELK